MNGLFREAQIHDSNFAGNEYSGELLKLIIKLVREV